MLFKKIAIAAAVATTLAFVGCAKKKLTTLLLTLTKLHLKL